MADHPRSADQDTSRLIEQLFSGDELQAEEAALALGLIGELSLDQLRPYFETSDPDRRWWIVRTISLLRSSTAHQALIDFLNDLDADVRACAAFSLGELRVEAAIKPLAERLKDDSVFVSAMASDALARIGRESVPALIECLRRGQPLERVRATKALLAILDPSSIPALIAALDDESPVVEHYASEALTRLGVGSILIKPQ
jgi:HEAT repeat protein